MQHNKISSFSAVKRVREELMRASNTGLDDNKARSSSNKSRKNRTSCSRIPHQLKKPPGPFAMSTKAESGFSAFNKSLKKVSQPKLSIDSLTMFDLKANLQYKEKKGIKLSSFKISSEDLSKKYKKAQNKFENLYNADIDDCDLAEGTGMASRVSMMDSYASKGKKFIKELGSRRSSYTEEDVSIDEEEMTENDSIAEIDLNQENDSGEEQKEPEEIQGGEDDWKFLLCPSKGGLKNSKGVVKDRDFDLFDKHESKNNKNFKATLDFGDF